MPLKDILQHWAAAVSVYKEEQYTEALARYKNIEDLSGRLYYNVACAHIKLEHISEAIESLTSAVAKDAQLAIAFFLRGVLYLKTNRHSEAKQDLHTTMTLMRDNSVIDYKQLGLLNKLYLSQVLYNIALTELKQGDLKTGEDTLHQALYHSEPVHRKQIQEALDKIEKGNIDDLEPLYACIEHVFTPPKVITNNLEKRKYIPKAKVVCAANATDVNPRFNGEKRVQEIRCFSELSGAGKAPKSPLLAIKGMFKKGSRTPTSGMRLNKSTGDLQALATFYELQSHDNAIKTIPVKPKPPEEATTNESLACILDEQKGMNTSHGHRLSLGSFFGNNLTTVSQVLSSSCDVLTAIVTPVIHIKDITEKKHDDCSHDGQNVKSSVSDMSVSTKVETHTSKDVDDFVDVSPEVKYTFIKNSLEKKQEDAQNRASELNEQYCQLTTSDNFSNDDDTSSSETDKLKEREPVRSQRPPPPSYPPPPLPPNVFINI